VQRASGIPCTLFMFSRVVR